jgi:hypothetical protein
VRQHLRGRVVRLCSIAAGVSTAVTVAAIALPAAANSARAPAAAGAAPAKAATLMLINGDRLAVRTSPSGRQQVAVRRAGGPGSLLTLRGAGTTYEIPTDALPYLGRGLDPSLFSLASLQREEKSGRLPVTVSYTAATRPRLPGVTITKSGRGTATGYLTPASAKLFGAALARQFRTDHARASYGQDGLFGDGVRIALAGVPAVAPTTGAPTTGAPTTGAPTTGAATVQPEYQMHTLTILGRNLQGQKDTGDDIMVFNAANPEIFGILFDNSNFFYKGVAKYSVPAGTYWAIGDFFSFSGNGGSERLTVLPQFTVKGATTIRVNERSASSQVTMATPRRTVASEVGIQFIRYGLHGASFSASWSDSGISLFASPTTAKPTFGRLQTYTSATMTSPPKTKGTPYFYNLDFQGPPGIIPPQHYVATPADLATVREVFYQDVKSVGGWYLFGGFPQQVVGLLFSSVLPFRLPTVEEQYYSAAPDIAWEFGYAASFNTFGGGQSDSFRVLPAGGQLTEDWNAYPLHPQPSVQLLTGGLARDLPQYPSAFRVGNSLDLAEVPFSDNYLGHLGGGYYGAFYPSVMVDSYAVYQNGKKIAHGNPAAAGIPPIKVSATPSTIRFALNAATWGPKYPLSPATSTSWTRKTRRDPAATVPASWYCGYTASFVLIHRCAIQPLLTLNYQVQGMSITGHTAPGPQTVDVSVGHLQQSASSAITGLTAAYSLNDGQSFKPATVTAAGHGQFAIGFSAPAGTDVTLRVSATDAAGGSITETIVRAYGVSS